MAIIAVIHSDCGILEAIELFGNEEEALRRGAVLWGDNHMSRGDISSDPDYSLTWEGIEGRGYRMHWYNDESDVWVTTPGPGDMSAWSLLSPEMFNAIGHHVMDAAAEEVTENAKPTFDECGSCSCWHPVEFTGDCRDDANRFASGQLDETYGDDGWTIGQTIEDQLKEAEGAEL